MIQKLCDNYRTRESAEGLSPDERIVKKGALTSRLIVRINAYGEEHPHE